MAPSTVPAVKQDEAGAVPKAQPMVRAAKPGVLAASVRDRSAVLLRMAVPAVARSLALGRTGAVVVRRWARQGGAAVPVSPPHSEVMVVRLEQQDEAAVHPVCLAPRG